MPPLIPPLDAAAATFSSSSSGITSFANSGAGAVDESGEDEGGELIGELSGDRSDGDGAIGDGGEDDRGEKAGDPIVGEGARSGDRDMESESRSPPASGAGAGDDSGDS